MSITSGWYGNGLYRIFNQDVNYASHSIKAALLTASYTLDAANHDDFGDVSTYEVTSSGYTAGGLALATKTTSYDATLKQVQLKCDDLYWTGVTFAPQYLIVYDDTPASGSKWLLGWYNFGSPQSVSGGAFPFSFGNRIILKDTVA